MPNNAVLITLRIYRPQNEIIQHATSQWEVNVRTAATHKTDTKRGTRAYANIINGSVLGSIARRRRRWYNIAHDFTCETIEVRIV